MKEYQKTKISLNKDDIIIAGKNNGETLNLEGFDYITIILDGRELILNDLNLRDCAKGQPIKEKANQHP